MNTISKEIESPVLLEGLVAAGLAPVVVPQSARVPERRIGFTAIEAICQPVALRALIRLGRARNRVLKQLDAPAKRFDLTGKPLNTLPNREIVEQLQQIGDRNHGYPNSKNERSHADARRLGSTSTIHQASGGYSAERRQQDPQCSRRSSANRIHPDRSAVYPSSQPTKQAGKLAAFLTADDDWIARNEGKTIFLLLTAAMVLPGVIEWMI